jgi:WD40 repeat protein
MTVLYVALFLNSTYRGLHMARIRHCSIIVLLLTAISAHAQQHDMQWIQRGNAKYAVGIKFSADGSTFITTAYQSGIRRWETSTGKLLNELQHPYAGMYWGSAAYSERYIVTPSTYPEPKLRLYDARTHEMLGGADVTDNLVAISGDEQYLMTGAYGGQLRLWALPSMKELGVISNATVMSLEFTPDSKYLLVGTTTGIEAYDIVTLKPADIISGGKEGVGTEFGFANNGSILFSAYYRGIILWDLERETRSNITFDAPSWLLEDPHTID